MTPASKDPDKHRRQLNNLPNLRGESTRGSWRPGAAPNLEHGLRSRRPAPAVLDPIVREIEDALADGLPLKDASGQVPAPDRFMVELAAIALLRVRRCAAYLELHGDEDGRGNLRPAFTESARPSSTRRGCSTGSAARRDRGLRSESTSVACRGSTSRAR